MAPPGEALEDWRILVNLARVLGLTLPYESSGDVRRALAAAMPGGPYAEADRIGFAQPLPASSFRACRSWRSLFSAAAFRCLSGTGLR